MGHFIHLLHTLQGTLGDNLPDGILLIDDHERFVVNSDNEFIEVVNSTPPTPGPPSNNYFMFTNRGTTPITVTFATSYAGGGKVFIDDVFVGNTGSPYNFPPGSTAKVTNLRSLDDSSRGVVQCSDSSANISIDRWDESLGSVMYANGYLFRGQSGIRSIKSWTGAEHYTELTYLFAESDLETVETWDGLDSLVSMYAAFYSASNLSSIPASWRGLESVQMLDYAFEYCYNLSSIPNTWEGLESVTSLYEAFYYCTSLTAIPESWRGLDSVTSLYYAFYNCENIVTGGNEDFSSLANVTDTYHMFSYCYNWTGNGYGLYEYLSTKPITVSSHSYTFGNCSNAIDYEYIPTDWGGLGHQISAFELKNTGTESVPLVINSGTEAKVKVGTTIYTASPNTTLSCTVNVGQTVTINGLTKNSLGTVAIRSIGSINSNRALTLVKCDSKLTNLDSIFSNSSFTVNSGEETYIRSIGDLAGSENYNNLNYAFYNHNGLTGFNQYFKCKAITSMDYAFMNTSITGYPPYLYGLTSLRSCRYTFAGSKLTSGSRYLYDFSKVVEHIDGMFANCRLMTTPYLLYTYFQENLRNGHILTYQNAFLNCGLDAGTTAVQAYSYVPDIFGGGRPYNHVVIDGIMYGTVEIAGRTWLLERLNYGTQEYLPGKKTNSLNTIQLGNDGYVKWKSYLYEYALKYGDIYGWHIPTVEEAESLLALASSDPKKLRTPAISGMASWRSGSTSCYGTDDFKMTIEPDVSSGYEYGGSANFWLKYQEYKPAEHLSPERYTHKLLSINGGSDTNTITSEDQRIYPDDFSYARTYNYHPIRLVKDVVPKTNPVTFYGTVYETKILNGNLRVMAENLAYDDGGDGITVKTINGIPVYFYNQAAAIRIANSIGDGWRLPNQSELNTALSNAGYDIEGVKGDKVWETPGTNACGLYIYPVGYLSGSSWYNKMNGALYWCNGSYSSIQSGQVGYCFMVGNSQFIGNTGSVSYKYCVRLVKPV